MSEEPKPVRRIAELRRARDWSYAALARACVPPTTASQVEKVEKGQTTLSLDWMRRIAPAFGVKPGSLLDDDDAEFGVDGRNCLEKLYSLPSVPGREALQIFGDLAGLMGSLSRIQIAADAFPGDPDVAKKMGSIWSTLSPQQQRRAVDMLETMVDFADPQREFSR